MKKQVLLFSLMLGLTMASVPLLIGSAGKKHKEKVSEEQSIWEAIQYRNKMLMNYDKGVVDPRDYKNAIDVALAQIAAGSRSGALNLNWEEIGPDNVGGRTRAILVDNDNSSRVYAGGVSGGLWISTNGGTTWSVSTGFREATNTVYNAIGSIAQGADGTLYVGTGEPHASYSSSYMPGNGVYKSTDRGVTWTHCPGTGITNDSVPEFAGRWSVTSRLAVDPTNSNTVYAALENGGLYVSTDGGNTWNRPAGITANSAANDVRLSNDGQVVWAVVGAKQVWRSVDRGATWVNLTTTTSLASKLVPAPSRVEIAIAPSDNNYVYLLASAGCLQGVYRTIDGGVTWTTLLGRGSTLDPFAQPTGGSGCQGGYDDCIAVLPSDRTKIYVGGVSFYSYSDGLSWKRSDKLGSEGGSYDSPNYIHADKHVITFDPKNPEIMFVGHDGGITRTVNAATGFPTPTYQSVDKFYNVTQFYSVAANRSGEVLGGAQDNGTRYIDYHGDTRAFSKQVLSGDGFYCEFSELNPNIMFGSIYFDALYRSGNRGLSMAEFFDSNIDPDGDGEPGSCTNCNPFVTTFFNTEARNLTNHSRLVSYVNRTGSLIPAGSTIQVPSYTGGILFPYTLAADLDVDSTIAVHDQIDAKVFLGTSTTATPGSGVWVCTNPLNLSQQGKWYKINIAAGPLEAFCASADGNIAYMGFGSSLYRVSGLNTADYSNAPNITGLTITPIGLPASGRPVKGIYVDRNDSNLVIVTRTGYGAGGASVLKSTDGINFTNITHNLPDMPVYDVVIDQRNNNNYIIGTELGFWSSSDAGATWNAETGVLGFTPVYRVRQVPLYDDACPVIYGGTHGRGFWRTTTLLAGTSCNLVSGMDNPKNTDANRTVDFTVFPNPVTDKGSIKITLAQAAKVELNIIDMPGRIMSRQSFNGTEGNNVFSFDAQDLPAGSYLATVRIGNNVVKSKVFIKY
jgi:photosystem II stability/assembly factor-like uncharacterized protein